GAGSMVGYARRPGGPFAPAGSQGVPSGRSPPGTAVPSTDAQLGPDPANPPEYQVLHPHASTRSQPGPHGPNTLDVTIVLPCYNEQDHVLLELERISKVMDASDFSYELLVIDDKSTDNTLSVLREALTRFPHI